MEVEVALNFAYPVVLGVILLISHLITFSKRDSYLPHYEEKSFRYEPRVIWCLQALLCVLFVCPSFKHVTILMLNAFPSDAQQCCFSPYAYPVLSNWWRRQDHQGTFGPLHTPFTLDLC